MSQPDTTAGDEPIRIQPNRDGARAPAADLAAALPDAAVERVKTTVVTDHSEHVTVWLVDDGPDEPTSIRAPGAWTIESVLVATAGGRAVRMTREPPEVED